MSTKEIVARFESERQALALMDHPSIAKVFDAGTAADGRPYFAMEYVKGEPITDHCDRVRATTQERIELMIEVCAAVQHAHQKAIIHRDLKPSNILVGVDGSETRPKVIDFGIAKAIGHKLTEQTMYTQLGRMVGTLEYMSPEQAEMNLQNVDTRTDVYSLGVLLYELLVGALPFDSTEMRQAGYDEARRRIREIDPPRPSTRVSSLGIASTDSAHKRRTEVASLSRELRGDLDWIVLKALEKDRTRRYGSPEELAADLRRHLRDEPVQARPPSAAYLMMKFTRRHRVGVAFATLAATLLAVLAISMTIQAARISAERDRANREAEAAESALGFLTDIFEISDPSEARGNTVTAREILDRGSERIQESLADQPEVQARLMGEIGNVYTSLGLIAPAEEHLERALELERQFRDPDDIDLQFSLTDLGWLKFERGDYASAETLFREALALVRRQKRPGPLDEISSLSAVAVALSRLARFDEAEQLLLEANRMLSELPEEDEGLIINISTNLANLYADTNRSRLAVSHYRRVLEHQEKQHGGEDHPQYAFAMDNLALALHDLEEYDEAEPMFRGALAMLRRIYGDEHPELAQTLGNVASFLIDTGRYDEAEELNQEALVLNRGLLGEDHPVVGDDLTRSAEILLARGDEEAAEEVIGEALAIYRRALPERHSKTAWAESLNGAILVAQKRYDEAEPQLLSSLQTLEQLGGSATILKHARRHLVALYQAQGREEEAKRYAE
jgi:non-specific serine/threonine protein kinase/serine/threonine-protein kinase